MTTEVGLPQMEAKVRLYHDAEGDRELLGFADLTVAGAFVIKGLRIVMGKPREDRPGGPFVSFPSRRGSGSAHDKFFEVAHPITAEARAAVKELVLRAYEEEARKVKA